MLKLFRLIASAVLCMAAVACSGPAKPKPTELLPAPSLMPVVRVWESKIGEVGFALDAKVVGSLVVLASSDGAVKALDVDTGAVRWAAQLDTKIVAGVGVDGDKVAVVTASGDLSILQDGKPLWQQKLGALAITPPLLAGGRAYVVTLNKTVMAFDASSGRRLWQLQREADSLALGKAGVLMPLGDTLVVGLGGRLLGLNPSTGAQRWEIPVAVSRATNEVERLVDVVAGVSRLGSSVCVRAYLHSVACIDAASSKLVWSKAAAGTTGVSGDAVAVFGAESDGRLVAWRRADGERLWQTETFKWRDVGPPVLLGSSVAVPDGVGLIHLVSARDGTLLGRMSLDGSPLAAAPVLAGKTLIVVTRKGGVLAFRPE
ncbi:outer membrane protein assembly factor BamB [Rhodoferax sp. OV413]|uniref:outer membrane protein assembly factor BamB n=1 Tax=Rhodoferax sp. OV413 TaxID=1855285 RepID=UPI0025EB61F0|nr:outer membrane protein assembly factor BamB [Rhodoferax sp. OV413]